MKSSLEITLKIQRMQQKAWKREQVLVRGLPLHRNVRGRFQFQKKKNDFNPFTAPAHNISGLESAHTHLQTEYFPVL